eukprot:2131351-Rhodomonas_salina.1
MPAKMIPAFRSPSGLNCSQQDRTARVSARYGEMGAQRYVGHRRVRTEKSVLLKSTLGRLGEGS